MLVNLRQKALKRSNSVLFAEARLRPTGILALAAVAAASFAVGLPYATQAMQKAGPPALQTCNYFNA